MPPQHMRLQMVNSAIFTFLFVFLLFSIVFVLFYRWGLSFDWFILDWGFNHNHLFWVCTNCHVSFSFCVRLNVGSIHVCGVCFTLYCVGVCGCVGWIGLCHAACMALALRLPPGQSATGAVVESHMYWPSQSLTAMLFRHLGSLGENFPVNNCGMYDSF